MNRVVLAAPGAEQVAALLARQLDAKQSPVEWRRFPDGESYFRLYDNLQDAEVSIVACLRDPDPQALGLWYLADGARDLGARSVGLVAPYLPYMRQDKRFHPGEVITSRTFARFLSQEFDWLATVDPHLHRWPSLDSLYTVPAVSVGSAAAIARWVAANVQDPVIIGPDSESEQWAADVARRIGCQAIALQKSRLGDRSVQISVPDTRAVAGRQPVLIDDIVSSARTMAVAARQLREAFGGAPVCVGVHAVFAPDALQVLKDAGAGRIVTCNTLPHETNAIDVTGDIAAAVRQLSGRPPVWA